MYSDTYSQLIFRFMFNCKTFYSIQYGQCHKTDFPSVIQTVSFWQTRYNHVCIANCFDLEYRKGTPFRPKIIAGGGRVGYGFDCEQTNKLYEMNIRKYRDACGMVEEYENGGWEI